MLLSQYTIGDHDHQARELSEFADLCTRLQYYIVRITGDYTAAIHLLQEHGVQSRLSLEEIDIAGGSLDLLADLACLADYLNDQQREAEKEKTV